MVCLKAELKNGIYLLKGEISMLVVTDVDCESKLRVWHRRLAHVSERSYKNYISKAYLVMLN